MKNIKSNKILLYLIIMILIVTVTYPTQNALQTKIEKKSQNKIDNNLEEFYQHTVLGEQGTATWCKHCPSMGYWLSKVKGDFVYIALVADKNNYASQRLNQLNLKGYPTTFFDGGHTEVVGHQYDVDNLKDAYDLCQERQVNDIIVSVGAVLDEQTDVIKSICYIDNFENKEYNGMLRVFVAEIESRWNEYDGEPYKNAMLGYTTNEEVRIPAGETLTISDSLNYPDIQIDNILIIAALYHSENDFLQQLDTTEPIEGQDIEDIPPLISIRTPKEDEIIKGDYEISGIAHHPKGDDKLRWTRIKIYDNDWVNTEGISDWSYLWDTTTVYDKTHYIKAKSSDGVIESDIDTVKILVNNYGNKPPIDPGMPIGPELVDAGRIYSYLTCTDDPNENNIRYGWDIDEDEIVDIWTDYYESGSNVQTNISWGLAGTYNLRVLAEDEFGGKSNFSDKTEILVTGTNQAPNTPDITGPSEGIIENVYTFNASTIDPEGTDIWYYFDWGDESNSGWRGPYSSGEEIRLAHIYREKDDFNIRVKAKDIHDKESGWASFRISVPKAKTAFYTFFERLLERFPILDIFSYFLI